MVQNIEMLASLKHELKQIMKQYNLLDNQLHDNHSFDLQTMQIKSSINFSLIETTLQTELVDMQIERCEAMVICF